MGRRKRLPREPIEFEISDLSHDGRGVGRHNDKVVFIQNALPGEKVMAVLSRRTRHFDEAVAVEVLNPSENRVAARCQFYDNCNGCTMMHLEPQQQILFKANTLAQNFKKMAGVSPQNWLPPLHHVHWNYRRRARLSVRWVMGKERVLVGFREKNGRYVADMTNCEVLVEPLADLIQPLSNLFTSMDARAEIPQVECSAGDAAISLIIRHMKPLSAGDMERLIAFEQHYELQIYLQSKGPDTIRPLNQTQDPLYFSMMDEALKMEFLPNDFIQVNKHMNEKMIGQALQLLDLSTDDVVLDLFCGLGNFTLPMASQVSKVVGVEGDAGLIERARHNAEINQLQNVEFHCADLTQDHSKSDWFDQQYTKVLIDPPRSGAWDILPLIAATGAETLVYVSCHPASLARDAEQLVNELGYQLVSAGVMDMFPHTSHVESMALFTKV
ncbi:23S rRNA (uracil(1939)-C(5))-methyltransferase RlmD [Marinicella sp. W31]|uniref:23S rRNA (uracil(1939)-C(5))-methyltransferase RlmD n=1 Tax=Marinicella sp. W31 TaxID=3023713 RepID=UPI003757FCF1